MAVIHLKLDDQLRNRFKALCSSKGTNMTAELLRMIERELEQKGGDRG